MKGFLRGSATAMITPFTENGVDFESFGHMMEYQIAGGTDAVIVAGTTGEPATMSEEERLDLLRFAVEKAKGRIAVIAGTGANSTKKAVENTVRAKELGALGVLAVTPYYNKCTQSGIVEYYRALCEIGIPVIAYNVPSRTGVNILPQTAERIADLPMLAGIKEASGNMAQVLDVLRRVREKCDVYSGEDALNLPILLSGGSAVVSVVSNLVPAAVKTLCELALSRRVDEAIGLSERLLPLAEACFAEVNPIPVKEGMNLLGFRAGKPRLPLTPLEEEHRALLADAMKKFGLEVMA